MATPTLLRVVERQAEVFRRLWRGSLGLAFVTPLLFLAAMGFGVGGMVDEQTGDVAGVAYLDFVAPGLMAASAMQLAAGASLWPVMAGIKWVGSFKAMVSTPVSPADVYGGIVTWNAIHGAMSSTAFLLIAVLLGAVPSLTAPLAVPAAVLGALAFAAPLTAFSATQETDFRFPVIMRLGVVPLFLFSGTFFPVSNLPGWLQPAAALSPLWHSVELCRGATTGHIDAAAALAHVAALALVVVVGWRWGTRAFVTRLTP